MKRILSLLVFSLSVSGSFAQVAKIVHPPIGTTAYSSDSTFSIRLIGKKQYYAPTETATADKDINSPKSVNMHPNATKYYVNSLEGATTIVYDFKTNEKMKVIRHDFTDADTVLLGNDFKPFYKFTHYLPDAKHPASPFGGWALSTVSRWRVASRMEESICGCLITAVTTTSMHRILLPSPSSTRSRTASSD